MWYWQLAVKILLKSYCTLVIISFIILNEPCFKMLQCIKNIISSAVAKNVVSSKYEPWTSRILIISAYITFRKLFFLGVWCHREDWRSKELFEIWEAFAFLLVLGWTQFMGFLESSGGFVVPCSLTEQIFNSKISMNIEQLFEFYSLGYHNMK